MMTTSNVCTKYVVGLDLGNYSAGMTAMRVDDAGLPVEILSSVSHIHDGGVGDAQSKDSRKAVSGVARRARRRVRNRKVQRQAVDTWLTDRGFPLISDVVGRRNTDPWEARARLVNGVIADDATFMELFSIAVRHISRHRGWRNPYLDTTRLYSVTEWSSDLLKTVEQARERYSGIVIPDDATIGQLGHAVVGYVGNREKTRGVTAAVKLEESDLTEDTPGVVLNGPKKGRMVQLPGVLSSHRLRQSDNARELERIFEVQSIEDENVNVRELIDVVFHQEPAKGSAEKNIGKDALDPTQRRVWKADESYQCYRIATQLANSRVTDVDGTVRRLSVDERQAGFEMLVSWTKKESPDWTMLEETMGLEPGQLQPPVSIEDDGEDLTGGPCVNDTYRQLATMSARPLLALKKWFVAAEAEGREALLYHLFSNVEQSGSAFDEELDDLVAELDTVGLEKLDGVSVASGRGAYGAETCRRLTEQILSSEDDLHDARRAVYGVAADWTPPAAALTALTGNAAVDRTISAVSRWLTACERRWGVPRRITLENGRDGLTTAKTRAERDKDAKYVAKKRRENQVHVATAFGLDSVSRVSLAQQRKYDAVTRQNGVCFYCGEVVDMTAVELDHIVAQAGPGSTTTRENLVAACARCNGDKANQLASSWIRSSSIPGVSMVEVLDRVAKWSTSPGGDVKELKRLQKAVAARVEQRTRDNGIDNRSVESMSWMSTEIRRRLIQQYADRGESVEVSTFGGATTAEARRTWVAGTDAETAVSVNTMIEMAGGMGKVRLDRRHHALDAAVIAVMPPMAAEVLAQRRALRTDARLGMPLVKSGSGRVVYGSWREFTGVGVSYQKAFGAWCERMVRVIDLFRQAMDTDTVHVTRDVRVRLGDGVGHADTVSKNKRRKLHSKWSVDDVNRVADHRMWCALTRLPDFDWTSGLPVDKQRSITVQGTVYGPKSRLDVMPSAGIPVRGGYVRLGRTMHHMRVYTFVDDKGRVRPYGERVFHHDLLNKHLCHKDLLSVELPAHSATRRFSMGGVNHPGAVARREGRTTLVGAVLRGDELEISEADARALAAKTPNLQALQDIVGPITRWMVIGARESGRVNLEPYVLSGEGVEDWHCDVEPGSDAAKFFDMSFLRMLSMLFTMKHVRVIRRNAFGEIREEGGESGMLESFTLVDSR